MEPGDPSIMTDKPRPKEEPVILAWMWISIMANGLILSAVIIGVYYMAMNKHCKLEGEDPVFDAEEISAKGLTFELEKARTVAFISLVWAEGVRSYMSRSFNLPVWTNLCANIYMLIAI